MGGGGKAGGQVTSTPPTAPRDPVGGVGWTPDPWHPLTCPSTPGPQCLGWGTPTDPPSTPGPQCAGWGTPRDWGAGGTHGTLSVGASTLHQGHPVSSWGRVTQESGCQHPGDSLDWGGDPHTHGTQLLGTGTCMCRGGVGPLAPTGAAPTPAAGAPHPLHGAHRHPGPALPAQPWGGL